MMAKAVHVKCADVSFDFEGEKLRIIVTGPEALKAYSPVQWIHSALGDGERLIQIVLEQAALPNSRLRRAPPSAPKQRHRG